MSIYSTEDYTSALGALMPPGLAWPRQASSVHIAVLRAIGRSYKRSDDAAQNLLKGSFPATATIMLSEWEKTLGLPDDCSISEIGGVRDRQRAVVSKLISTGDLTRSYYIGVLAALGYTVTITQFRPSMCGMSACGDALNGEEWPFTWRINAPKETIKYALAGGAYCGDPLASWGNKQLECVINRIAPSHLNIIFNYS